MRDFAIVKVQTNSRKSNDHNESHWKKKKKLNKEKIREKFWRITSYIVIDNKEAIGENNGDVWGFKCINYIRMQRKHMANAREPNMSSPCTRKETKRKEKSKKKMKEKKNKEEF